LLASRNWYPTTILPERGAVGESRDRSLQVVDEDVEARFRHAWRELQRGPSIRRAEAYARRDHPELDLRMADILGAVVEFGEARLTDLSAALGMNVSNASRTVNRLVKNGYVTRTDSPEDGRALSLSATKEGERVWSEINDRRTAAVRYVLGQLSPSQRAAAVRLLERMVASVDAFAADLES
jgi:DNA-binding MarR family transcriptional regulator